MTFNDVIKQPNIIQRILPHWALKTPSKNKQIHHFHRKKLTPKIEHQQLQGKTSSQKKEAFIKN
jgi:hypothetical protein